MDGAAAHTLKGPIEACLPMMVRQIDPVKATIQSTPITLDSETISGTCFRQKGPAQILA